MTTYSENELKTFEFSVEGERVVSASFSMTFFVVQDFQSCVQPLLDVYEKALLMMPPGKLTWYITENMTRYKPIGKRTSTLLETWLREKPPRPYIHLHLRDGESFLDTPEFGIWIWGQHDGSTGYGMRTNVVRLHFPASYAWEKTEEMYSVAREIGRLLPVQSGLVGFTLERSDFRKEESDVRSWQLSMDHPGADIANEITDAIGVGQDGIKGVGWLTLLHKSFVNELGGESALRNALPLVSSIEWTGDVLVIRATQTAIFGWMRSDEQLEAYKQVYRCVAPLIQRTADRPYGAFSFPLSMALPMAMQETRNWLLRLGDGS